MFPLEPGPFKLITDDEIPRARKSPGIFEHTAAPVSQQLAAQHAVMAGPQAQVTDALDGNIDADFNATIPAARGEINAQLGSLSDIDPAHAYVAALEASDEAGNLQGSFAPQGISLQKINVPPDGSDPLDVKEDPGQGPQGPQGPPGPPGPAGPEGPQGPPGKDSDVIYP